MGTRLKSIFTEWVFRAALLAALFFASLAQAKVQVLFLELRWPDGRVVELEPGGRFGHLAISYQGQWLHAYPTNGVEVVTMAKLRRLGRVIGAIDVDREPLTEEEVAPFLGRAFDFQYDWDNEKTYCAELIAKLLGLEPKTMTFQGSRWPRQFRRRNRGRLGLSPDDVFFSSGNESSVGTNSSLQTSQIFELPSSSVFHALPGLSGLKAIALL